MSAPRPAAESTLKSTFILYKGEEVEVEGPVAPSIIFYWDVVQDGWVQLTQERFDLVLKNAAILGNFKSQVVSLASQAKFKMLENAGHDTQWLKGLVEE